MERDVASIYLNFVCVCVRARVCVGVGAEGEGGRREGRGDVVNLYWDCDDVSRLPRLSKHDDGEYGERGGGGGGGELQTFIKTADVSSLLRPSQQ